jgi:hypothetical protein
MVFDAGIDAEATTSFDDYCACVGIGKRPIWVDIRPHVTDPLV